MMEFKIKHVFMLWHLRVAARNWLHAIPKKWRL